MKLRVNFASAIDRWPAGAFNLYAMATAFATYFAMYAFRKPFSAATFAGLHVGSTEIELKTAFVVSQIIGYAASKFLGIKFCTEASRAARPWLLVSLVGAAELALVLFAVVPNEWMIVALFLNGLPLGMIWGLVVRYLEGRRTSDILLAALACSFIVSSGVVKDVGRALMAGDAIRIFGIEFFNPFPSVSEFWMPAATGLLFAPLFLLSVFLLNQLPEPNRADALERTEREPMDFARRWSFLLQYLPGILALIAAYVLLTAFRDFRDNYMVELLDQLGYRYEDHRDLMSRMELGVMSGVMVAVSMLFWVKDNRRGLFVVFAAIAAGTALIGVATLLLERHAINGMWWMALIGFGSYLAYVPYNTVLFDRLMASTRFVGTAVFGMYLADSAGYSGSVVVQLGKDVFVGDLTRLEFMQRLSFFVSIFGTLSVLASWLYFVLRRTSDEPRVELTAEPATNFAE
ncbi:MAG: DUF5690 family protein [Pirellulales bacterium]